MQKSQNFLLVVFLGALVLIGQSVFIVREVEQVMVMQFGKPVNKYTEPGLKFKIPFIQSVRTFDKRVLDVDPTPEEVILADQKRIVVYNFARYRIIDMLEFSKSLSTEQQANSRLNNIINSTLRSTLGTATLVDILSDKRSTLMSTIRNQVNGQVNRLGIEIVDVRIGRADLPEQTSQAIFARMRTERARPRQQRPRHRAAGRRGGAHRPRARTRSRRIPGTRPGTGAGDQIQGRQGTHCAIGRS